MPEVDRKRDPHLAKGRKSSMSKLVAQPVADNPQQRLKWIAHLEFAQSVRAEKGRFAGCIRILFLYGHII